MATSTETTLDNVRLDAWLDHRMDELLPRKLREPQVAVTPSMSLIATKGTLDWACPPFILASTAAALLLYPTVVIAAKIFSSSSGTAVMLLP